MSKRSGFTLLELSVVIVIIGLLIGGLTIGQDLIRNYRVLSVLTDKTRFVDAIKLFKDKYGQLPGDFQKATDVWGTASGGCPGGARTGTQTCNGNGDGRITWGHYDSYHGGAATYHEIFLAWQHLANAKFISGTYTGVTGSGSTRNAVPDINIPKGKIKNTGFTVLYLGDFADASFYGGRSGHTMYFGKGVQTAGYWEAIYGGLTAQEAYGLDLKADDGKPGTGNIKTFTPSYYSFVFGYSYCTNSADAATAVYNDYTTSKDAQFCSLYFTNLF